MMKTLLCSIVLCATVGCATDNTEPTMLDDAIKATSELKVGMSGPDTIRLLNKHGIQISYSCGGPSPYGWTGSRLDDKSRLFLWFDYRNREVNEDAPGILVGWEVKESGRVLEQHSKAPPFVEKEGKP